MQSWGVEDSGAPVGPTHALPPLELSENALTVLEHRYLVRNPDGTPAETPAGLFHRVAVSVAEAERRFVLAAEADAAHARWSTAFESMMRSGSFLPNSPTLMNAGRDAQQLAACFVLPLEDSMDAIFETLKIAALVHKSGGGTGFSFSRLRPRNDFVASASGVASGPVSFLAVFDAATEHVRQGGTRRGANMAVLRYDHPDIVEFVECKLADEAAITNFNLSVGVDEDFMVRVRTDDRVDLVNPRTGETVGAIRARELMERIVGAAWQCGDPGLVFLDRVNEVRTNPTPGLGLIEATNPCGEQPLLPYEACTLGSVNLDRFAGGGAASLDWGELRRVVHAAVRFLDDVIEVSRFPVAQIGAMTRDGNRKVGLGVMGWADLLIRLGIPYDSEAALDLAAEVSGFIQTEADAASEALGDERGCFPNWEHSHYGGLDLPMRNATRTTIAPTGTISIIAGASSGIEPVFAASIHRHVLDGRALDEVHPQLRELLERNGVDDPAVLDEIVRTGRVRAAAGVPDAVAAVFPTAHDVDPKWHVRMQAAFQRHVDCAVSKTVNLPRDATPDDVDHVFRLAHELGCKGVTVFREGSRSHQVLNAGVAERAAARAPAPVARTGPEAAFEAAGGNRRVLPRPVPDDGDGLPSRRFRVPTPLGTMNVFVTELAGDPFEVFVVFGKAGSDLTAMSEAIGRLASLALRSGIPVEYVVEQLRGIGGRSSIGFGDQRVLSVVDALAKLLETNYVAAGDSSGEQPASVATAPRPPGADADGTPAEVPLAEPVLEICPECQEYTFEFAEGCGKCHSCGFSTC
ncbi:MAG: vitamin B12-dependent ribonucleotide reductase [Acidimicrobiia bacterium]